LNSQIHFVSSNAMTFIVIIYKGRRAFFTTVQHIFNCDTCCCVERTSLPATLMWPSIVLLRAVRALAVAMLLHFPYWITTCSMT